jgi:hypothetical protein
MNTDTKPYVDEANAGIDNMHIYCVCGKEVPLKVITEDEPDKEVKEHYYGKVVLMCYDCLTIYEVKGKLKKSIDEAARMGGNVYLA